MRVLAFQVFAELKRNRFRRVPFQFRVLGLLGRRLERPCQTDAVRARGRIAADLTDLDLPRHQGIFSDGVGPAAGAWRAGTGGTEA